MIERAVILCGDGGMLEVDHFGFSTFAPPASASPAAAPAAPASSAPAPHTASARMAPGDSDLFSLAEMEKRHIFAALEKTNQNRTHAAKLLGISIRTLRNKLHEYGVAGKEDDTATVDKPE